MDEIREYSVLFSSMDELTVTATGTQNNIISQIHSPSVNDVTIDLTENSGNSQVNLLEVPPVNGTPQPQQINVYTGVGSDVK